MLVALRTNYYIIVDEQQSFAQPPPLAAYSIFSILLISIILLVCVMQTCIVDCALLRRKHVRGYMLGGAIHFIWCPNEPCRFVQTRYTANMTNMTACVLLDANLCDKDTNI